MKKILLSFSFMGLIATGVNAQGKLLVVHNSPDPALATVDVWTEVAAAGVYQKLADDVKYKDGYFYTIPSLPIPGANLVIHLKAANSTMSSDPDLYSQTVTGVPTGNNVAVINGVTAALAVTKTNPGGVPTTLNVDFITSGVQFSSSNANQIQAAVHHGVVDADSVYVQSFITTIQQPARDVLAQVKFRKTGVYTAIPAASRRLHIIPAGAPQTSPAYAANGDALKTLGGKAAFVVATGFRDTTGTNSANTVKLMAYVTDATTADGVITPAELPAEKVAGVVQVFHDAADPKVKAVDLYVGGMKQVIGLVYRTGFQSAGFIQDFDYNIDLNPKDSSNVVLSTKLRFDSDSVVAVVSGVVDTTGFSVNPDGESRKLNFFLNKPARVTQPAGSTMVTVFHGATDAPTVSLTYNLGGTQVDLISGLKYGKFQTATVPGIGSSLPTALGTIVADLRLPGGALYKSYLVPLAAIDGRAVTVCASGFVDTAANQNGTSFKLFLGIPSSPFPQILFLKDTSIANSINDPSVADLGFRMFPNPVANQLVMAFDVQKSTNVAIDIIDINGRVVKAVTNETFSQATNVKSVNTTELSNGLYFARVKSDTKTSVYKFNVLK